MKIFRNWCWVPIIIIVIYGFWNWYYCCEDCDKHYVDVYIHTDCLVYTMEIDDAIASLFVHPGDLVVWNNTTADSAKIIFNDGDFFGISEIEIPAKARAILEVVETAPSDGSYQVECSGGVASPRVIIGEGP